MKAIENIDPFDDLHDKIIDCINEFLSIGIEKISDSTEESFVFTVLCRAIETAIKHYYSDMDDRAITIDMICDYLKTETKIIPLLKIVGEN
jgi:hypothetical protein